MAIKPFPTLKIPASFPSFPLRRQILPRVLTFGVNRACCVAGWRGDEHTSCKFRVHRIHQPRDSMESEAISTFTPSSLSSLPNLFPSIHFTLPALTTSPLNSMQTSSPPLPSLGDATAYEVGGLVLEYSWVVCEIAMNIWQSATPKESASQPESCAVFARSNRSVKRSYWPRFKFGKDRSGERQIWTEIHIHFPFDILDRFCFCIEYCRKLMYIYIQRETWYVGFDTLVRFAPVQI